MTSSISRISWPGAIANQVGTLRTLSYSSAESSIWVAQSVSEHSQTKLIGASAANSIATLSTRSFTSRKSP